MSVVDRDILCCGLQDLPFNHITERSLYGYQRHEDRARSSTLPGYHPVIDHWGQRGAGTVHIKTGSGRILRPATGSLLNFKGVSDTASYTGGGKATSSRIFDIVVSGATEFCVLLSRTGICLVDIFRVGGLLGPR